MKLCFVIGSLSYSGAEKIMYNLINYFKVDNDVSVILMAQNSETENLEKVKQYPIYDKNEIYEGRIKRTLKRQKVLRNIVKKENFDVIVSFGVIYNIDLIEACLNSKSKIILCERNDPYNDPHSKLLRFRRRLSYRFADGFVFQTEEIQKYFSKRIQKRSIIIPNFIEKRIEPTNRYCPKRKAIATSARLDNRQKNQLNLIRAFKKFYTLHSDFTLEFYGEGPDRELLENEVKRLNLTNNVEFHGRVNNPMQFIRESTAFVLSSNYEGMPNALIEAMAYGMPCISTDCSGGGAKALIINEINGLLIPINDLESLEKAFEKICDNEFANKLSSEAYKINDTLEMNKILTLWNDYIKGFVTNEK